MDISMTDEEVHLYVAQQKVGRLATVSPDGQPHAAPIWHFFIDGDLYFETQPNSRKGLNIRSNQNVSLTFDSGGEFHDLKGVTIVGHVEIVEDDALLERFFEAQVQRYFGTREHPGFKALQSMPKPMLLKLVPERTTSWDYSKWK